MLGLCKKLFRNLTAHIEYPAQMLPESFLQSLRKASSNAEQKEAVYTFLQAHYEKNNFSKVVDFPLDGEWINATQPISIHRDLKGKLVLLDFFTYCCINCMHILPDLETLENKYSVEDGLVVIGVHCAKFPNEKQLKNITSAVERYGIKHAVVNDSNGIVWDSFDVHCWPTLILIGPESELLFAVQGEGHLSLLDCFIENALSFMKNKKLIEDHSLPQIKITNEIKSFGLLSFPGKITSLNSEENSILAVADSGHNRIIVLDDSGVIKHIIGRGEPGLKDGDFGNALFNAPQGLVFKNENILYVADTENHAIREINLKEETVKTVAGTGEQGNDRIGGKFWNEQELSSPWDVCFGKDTNVLLIAMAGMHQIWALYLSDDEKLFKKGTKGECKAIAGSGREENRNNCYPHAAAFAQPSELAFCPERNSIFIADSESSAIRELNLDNGKVTGVIGGSRNPSDLFAFGDIDGNGSDVKLQHPLGVTWNDHVKKLYVADSYNHKIKVVDLLDNSCSSLKLNSTLNEPGGLCSKRDQLIIADTNNHHIKFCDLNNFNVSLLSITECFPKKKESTDIEKCIEISKNGGKLHVFAKLIKPNTLSFTEEAPAYWDIKFIDEQSNPVFSGIREKLSLETDFVIDVPEYSNKSVIKVLLIGSAYFCKGDSCFPSNIKLSIIIRYNEKASENVDCYLSYNIE